MVTIEDSKKNNPQKIPREDLIVESDNNQS